MAYTHGVYIQENETQVIAPVTADSGVQFIVGTAPINLLDDPEGAVNVPILINSYAEAVENLGFSYSYDKFTICQSIYASFQILNVAPLVVVNVLNPAKHYQAVADEVYPISSGQILIEEEGILINSNFTVKSGDGNTTYVKDTDYTLAFDDNGYVLLKVLSDGDIGSATQLSLEYHQLDPTLVTKDDIIGGYSATTGKYTGLYCIEQVYPKLSVVPGLIVAPGWSQIPEVGIAMSARTESINGCFNCMAVKDIDASEDVEYSAVNEWKTNNSYTDANDLVCWPMIKVGTRTYYFSAVLAPLIAYTDYENDSVPYVSPSNKKISITGTILRDGTEVYLTQAQATYLNGVGIITAININGWRTWGNNTGIYPGSTDVKDRWIPVRRMFNWWGNTFLLTYFQKVDDPMNQRLIEALVESENIRANGYKARYQIADARMEYCADDNPTTDLLNGIIRFRQYLTPYPPAETIINVLEYDPDALTAALEGGEA